MVNWVLNGSGELIIISENTIKRTTQGASTVTVSTSPLWTRVEDATVEEVTEAVKQRLEKERTNVEWSGEEHVIEIMIC